MSTISAAQSVGSHSLAYPLNTGPHVAQGREVTPPHPVQARAPGTRGGASPHVGPARAAVLHVERPLGRTYAARVLTKPVQPKPDSDKAIAELLPLPITLSRAIIGFIESTTRSLEARDQAGLSTVAWSEGRSSDETMRSAYYELKQAACDYADVIDCSDDAPGFQAMKAQELAQIQARINDISAGIIDALMDRFLPKGNEVELEVSASTQAGFLHAKDLVEMYRRYCGGQFQFELLGSQDDKGGIRSARIRITGKNAYAYFLRETGLHRFEAVNQSARGDSRIYTNSVKVLALAPQALQSVEIRAADLEVTFLKAFGPGGQHTQKNETGVRLIHRPTGIIVVATDQRSKTQNMQMARSRLQEKLDQLERDRVRGIENSVRRDFVSGNHAVHTYDRTRGLISDNATGLRYNLQDVMAGKSEAMFLASVLAWLEGLIS